MPTLSTSQSFQTAYYRVANFGFATLNITDTYPAFFYPFTPQQMPAGTFFADFQNLSQGDFNGDGAKDVALTWAIYPHFFQRSDALLARPLIFFNDGQGNLRTDAARFNPAASPGGTTLETSAVADFNRDGIDDIVSASGGLNRLLDNTYVGEPIPLLLSGPGGVFQNGVRNIAGQENGTSLPSGFLFAHDVTVGDYDRDGDADIYTNGMLLLNDGAGRFSNAQQQLPTAMRTAPTGLWFSSTSGDFDGDGTADIAVFGGAPGVPKATAGGYVMLSKGSTSISGRTVADLPLGLFGASLNTTRDSAVGDLDKDGDLDIVALHSRDQPNFLRGIGLQVLLNNGSGNFTDGTAGRIDNGPLSSITASGGTTGTTGYGGSDINLMDWNGDGHLDMIVHSGLGSFTGDRPLLNIFQNDGMGRFDAVDVSLIPYVQPWQLAGYERFKFNQPIRQTAPVDLNGDRMIDFVSVVDTMLTSSNPLAPRETTAYTMLSQAVYGTGPGGVDGHTVGAPGFNEVYYLRTHASAAAAVAQGQYATGLAHYLAVGKAQGLRDFAPGTAVWGGNGVDTVRLSGNAADYTITRTAAGVTVRDGTATDTLNSIERLQFNDLRLALDVNGNGGQAYRLYQAAFNRTPDAGGLGFQMNALDSGFTLKQVAQNFLNSPEFRSTYGANLSDGQYVTQLYQNVLHRAPDSGGLAFQVNALATGTDRAQLLVNFSESPENQATLIGTIQNGMIYTI